MFYINPRVFLFFIVFIFHFSYCIKFSTNYNYNNTGSWKAGHTNFYPLTNEGKQYWFSLIENGPSWMISEIFERDKITGTPTNSGSFKYIKNVEKTWPLYGEDETFFLYCIVNDNWWSIIQFFPLKEKHPEGHKETDSGCFYSRPAVVTSYRSYGRVYVIIVARLGNAYFIRELLPTGRLGPETDHGTWDDRDCQDGFMYKITGRNYFYCYSQIFERVNTTWSIMELLPDGKMGEVTDKGYWDKNHLHTTFFRLKDRYYMMIQAYENRNRTLIFQELLEDGKMGTEINKMEWHSYYRYFTYTMNERTFIYMFNYGRRWYYFLEILP